MKNKTFSASGWCALKGLGYAIKTEKNYRYYFLIILTFTVLNIIVGVPYLAYITQWISVFGVFSAECTNTALEHLIDMQTKEIKEEIRIIKDVAAGAVVTWGIAYFGGEFIWIILTLLGVC